MIHICIAPSVLMIKVKWLFIFTIKQTSSLVSLVERYYFDANINLTKNDEPKSIKQPKVKRKLIRQRKTGNEKNTFASFWVDIFLPPISGRHSVRSRFLSEKKCLPALLEKRKRLFSSHDTRA